LRCLLILTAVLATSALVRGDDWPEFRGPTGQGHAPGRLPIEWGPQHNVAWKQALPGAGWSSPIVWKDRLYLTTAVPIGDNGDQSLRALCLDATKGKMLWDREVFRQDGATAPAIHAKNGHASPTPLTDGQRLYVHFGHQGSAALDLQGQVLWRQTELSYRPVHGNGGSPILVDDALVFSCDGSNSQFVIALDAATGTVRWKTPRRTEAIKKFAFATPLLITVGDRRQIISQGAGLVGAYEPTTGKEIWRVRYGDGYSVVPRPVYAQGLVFVCTGYDEPGLLAIRPDGQGDVTDSHVAWRRIRGGVPLNPSPLLVGEELYLISDLGVATCLEAKTGKVHWQERVGGAYSAAPLFGDGRIYLQSEAGAAVVIQAGKTFVSLARNNLGERVLASYAVADGALFIRGERHLFRIQAP
jgi:outer membrane protein assembly factor BamB